MSADAADRSLLEERLEIETPERVRIVYDLAGIGSRFAAGTIDFFLLGFAGLVVAIVVMLAAGVAMPRTDEARQVFFRAGAGVLIVVTWGYFLGFELAWAGQTPGKRALKLRVMSDKGGPASAAAIVVRNVLRAIDLLPGAAPYALAGIVMFVNRKAKRIGDFAAGTVVVRERADPMLAAPAPASAPSPPAAGGADDIAPEDLVRIRTYFARSAQLRPDARVAVARRLAEQMAQRYGLVFDKPEHLLGLLASGKTPRERREASGPLSW